jgi:hypothetical protein
MQIPESVETRLKEINDIYAKAKQMILLAEELDPSFRSNVMVIKELRDSHDHFMRLFNEWFCSGNSTPDEKYMLAQLDKARGHIFRAGYDAIDGIVVSYKIKVAKAMEKISNGAISEVCPDFYEKAPEVDRLSAKIAGHRNDKDVADDSLQNLAAYAEESKHVAEFCSVVISKVPFMMQWDKKQRRGLLFEKVGLALIVAIVGGITIAFVTNLMKPKPPIQGAPVTATPPVPFSAPASTNLPPTKLAP